MEEKRSEESIMSVPVADITLKMIDFYKGNHHDINHFLKVYAYAKTLGEVELATREERDLLEVTAILHDIAIPYCLKTYGHAQGPYQEREGIPMAKEFLKEFDLPVPFVEKVAWLVGHHHTLTGVTMKEHRLLLEADYLVNADEGNAPKEQIENAMETFFESETGKRMLRSIYLKK